MAILVIQAPPSDLEAPEYKDLKDKLAFALESSFGGEIYQADSLAQALATLKSPPGSAVSLVIYDCLSSVGGADLETLQAANPKLGCVLCLDLNAPAAPKLKWEVLAIVDRSELLKNLLDALKKLIDEDKVQLGYRDEDFCKIKTSLLLSVCPLKSDVYIRLSETKFVKVFKEGDFFEMTDMEKYTVKKGIEYLYIRKAGTAEFIEKYNADLAKLVPKAQSMTHEQIGKLQEDIHETVASLGRSVGFNKEVQQMAKVHVQLTVKSMDKSMRLGSILDRIKAYGGQYIGAHSGIVGYMACAIASQMEWASDATFQKLTLAAFMHDVTLANHELAACNTLQEAEASGFDPAEISQFKYHPAKAAEIARQFQEVPPDVDVIIMQHHERPDGKGFPRGIAYSYIAPLATVFIVAHDMAQYFLKHDSKMDRDAFLATVREKYKSSQFRKVLEAIERL